MRLVAAPPPRRARKPARARSGDRPVFASRSLPYLLLLPQLLIVGVFFLWPSVRVVGEAFKQTNAFGLDARFSGLANFVAALANGSDLQSIEVTLIFATSTTVLSMAVGLLVAVQVEHTGRSRAIYRTLFVWTYAVPSAVAGAVWLFLFEPGLGPGARLLTDLGVRWNFALNADQAMALIVALTVWQQSAYDFLFFTAGLQGVPDILLDAAAVDGAGRFSSFWRVTFPLLAPVTFFLLVMDFLYAFFSSFAVVDIITQGGPAGATNTLVYQLYRDGFQNGDSGIAGAETIVLLAMAAVLTAAQFRILHRRVHYR